jgi:DNA-binding CsgD family transcriptional regulator
MALNPSSSNLAFLKQKVNFYELVLNSVPALVYINTFTECGNPGSLSNVWCNSYACKFIGYTQEEIDTLGFEFFVSVLHPEDLEIIKNPIMFQPDSLSEKTYTFLQRLKPRGTNSYKWMYGNGVVLEMFDNQHPKTSLNVIMEITNQMNTENQLVAALQEINRLRNELRCKSLSKREKEVLKNIVRGLTDREISAKLFISPATAKTHRYKIIKKLGFKNSASLAAFAAGCGLG